MSQQAELELFRTTPDDPNVLWLVAELERERGWLSAADLQQRSGDRLSDRMVRVLAAGACPLVISGQKGYRATRHATADEICRFVRWMESQATEMTSRAERVRRFAHSQLAA
jgi:hypothetical protein